MALKKKKSDTVASGTFGYGWSMNRCNVLPQGAVNRKDPPWSHEQAIHLPDIRQPHLAC
jgi:hypothetical protein